MSWDFKGPSLGFFGLLGDTLFIENARDKNSYFDFSIFSYQKRMTGCYPKENCWLCEQSNVALVAGL